MEMFLHSLRGRPEMDSLKEKLENGIKLTTDYSGTGQPEYVMQRLCDWAAAELGIQTQAK